MNVSLAATLLRLAGNERNLKVLASIARAGTISAADVAGETGLSLAVVYNKLRLFKVAEIVVVSHRSKSVLYSITGRGRVIVAALDGLEAEVTP